MKGLLFPNQEGNNSSVTWNIRAEENEDMQGCDHRMDETADEAEKTLDFIV